MSLGEPVADLLIDKIDLPRSVVKPDSKFPNCEGLQYCQAVALYTRSSELVAKRRAVVEIQGRGRRYHGVLVERWLSGR